MKYLGSFYHVTTEVQRILNRLAALEQSVSAGSGGGGGGTPFDDTAGITTLTDMRGWDGSGGGHSITLQGSDLVLRGSNSILFQTPAILATAAPHSSPLRLRSRNSSLAST